MRLSLFAMFRPGRRGASWSRRQTSDHLCDATLRALAVGESAPAIRDRASEHLAGCAMCRTRLSAVDPLETLFADVPAPARVPAIPLPPVRRPWSLPAVTLSPPRHRLAAGFAVGALAVAGIATVVGRGAGVSGDGQAQQLASVRGRIQTASEKRDVAMVRQELGSLTSTARSLDKGAATQPSVLGQLMAAHEQVAKLAPSPARAQALGAVDSAIALGGETPPPDPPAVPDATADAQPTQTPDSTPSDPPTPEPTPSDTPAPTDTPTPLPTDTPTPQPTDAAVNAAPSAAFQAPVSAGHG